MKLTKKERTVDTATLRYVVSKLRAMSRHFVKCALQAKDGSSLMEGVSGKYGARADAVSSAADHFLAVIRGNDRKKRPSTRKRKAKR